MVQGESTPGARPKVKASTDGPHGRLQIGTKRAKEGVLTCSSGFGLRTVPFPLAPGYCLLTQRVDQKEEVCRREAYIAGRGTSEMEPGRKGNLREGTGRRGIFPEG